MLVASYFGEGAQFVRSGSQESSVGAVTCGVLQRSVLGPLLFISDIDDVSRVIRYCRFKIYADDLQIYQTCAVSDFEMCIDLTWRQVLWALFWLKMLGFSFCRFCACLLSVLFVFAILFCFVHASEEFGSPGSSFSCEESVLCCTGLPGV
jgi:hypothetical protein